MQNVLDTKLNLSSAAENQQSGTDALAQAILCKSVRMQCTRLCMYMYIYVHTCISVHTKVEYLYAHVHVVLSFSILAVTTVLMCIQCTVCLCCSV